MIHRGWFFLSFFSFSLLLCASSLFPSDKIPNSDIISTQAGGKVVGQIPVGNGTVTMNTNAPQMPSVPMDINPHIPNNQPSGRSSNAGGLLGFIFNLGKKSSKEIARDKVVADLDRALSTPPLPPTGRMPPKNFDLASNVWSSHMMPAPVAVTPPIPTPPLTPSSVPGDMMPAPVAVTPPIPTPPLTPSSVPGAQLPKNMTSCTEAYSYLGGEYVPVQKIPSYIPTNVPAVPNMGSLINDNPFKGSSGPYTGGGVSAGDIGKGFASIVVPTIYTKSLLTAGGVKTIAIGGGSTVAGGTVAVAGGGTVAGGTVSGGTAAGGAAAGEALIAVAAPLAATAVLTLGFFWASVATWEYFVRPEDGFIFSSKKAPSLIPQHTPSNNAPTQPSNTPNPKKPEEPKDRAEKIRNHKRWTNKEAREHAKALNKGYVEKKDKPAKMKDIGFTNGKEWISPDMDGHNGGVWKLFDLKGNRIATLDKNLNRIKS